MLDPRTAALALLALWPAACGPAVAQDGPRSAGAILARVKAGLRASARPAFVAYTLERKDTLDFAPDFLNSYTLRIWCRTADSAALSRRATGSSATGPAEYIVPMFDKPVDPGPPTADLLDVIRQMQTVTTASPAPVSSMPPVIGSVSVVIERNYHVTLAGTDGNDDHLHLEALGDPDRNRLTDLYVDRTTFALHRAVAHDHLYADGAAFPERFEIDFGSIEGVAVITAIHGESDSSAPEARMLGGVPNHTVDYRFENIAFPSELPAWYFEPARYGEHRDELPS